MQGVHVGVHIGGKGGGVHLCPVALAKMMMSSLSAAVSRRMELSALSAWPSSVSRSSEVESMRGGPLTGNHDRHSRGKDVGLEKESGRGWVGGWVHLLLQHAAVIEVPNGAARLAAAGAAKRGGAGDAAYA